jgi:plastocyanin
MLLDFPQNPALNDSYTLSGTTWIYDGTVWNVVSTSTVINIDKSNSFENIVVGNVTITAETPDDTLTITAGNNVEIVADEESKSISISATSSGPPGESNAAFTTISVADQPDIVADSSSDILNFAAGSGISITTNASTDTVTITNIASLINNFSQLSDILSANLTIDQIYLPAITMLIVTNSGAQAYRFDQYGTINNPTVYAINGTTIAFKLTASGHPFLIQTGAGNNYNTGLVHVATNGTVSTGAAAQGRDSGTLYWKIPTEITGGYRYQCSIHAPMVGSITIKTFATL